jgi:hypothetical protein
MPGIAHLITGFTFAILLFNMNPKTFTKKHALIFTLMCYTGPDFAHFLSFSEFDHRLGHSVLGWPIYCLWMVPIFTFLTRFSVDYATKHLKDDGWNAPTRLRWWQVYFLMVAGGLFHFAVDITMETKRLWPFPLSDPTFIDVLFFRDDLLNWALIENPPSIITIVPYIILIAMLYIGNYQMQQVSSGAANTKLNLLVGTGYGLFLLYYFLFGISGGENDFGAIGYFGLFFFAPFTFILLTRSPENLTPGQNKTYNAELGNQKLQFVIGWLFFSGAIFSTAVIGAYTFLHDILPLLVGIVAVFGVLFFMAGILLLKRKNAGQRLSQILLGLSGVLIIPLVIYGILREREVQEILN